MITQLRGNKSLDKNHFFGASFLFAVVLVSGFLTQDQAFSIDFAAQKSALLQKLDSLDMEKQIRKRKGQSIEDLENLSATIKDSIAGVKKELARGEGVPTSKLNEPAGIQQYVKDFRKYLPQNTFDWIVVVVGFIAIIAGAILCVGLIGMALKKIFRKKRPPLKTMHEIFPQTVTKNDSEYLSKSGGGDADAADTRIDSLRQRIKEESIGAPLTGSGQNTVQPSISGEPAADTAGLKNRIITAAGQGADIQEISRRFRVGADQVSLILRVARQEGDTSL
ncbi:MAG: hypothetical protein WBM07_19055 [Chitinivibrionales bacterium]